MRSLENGIEKHSHPSRMDGVKYEVEKEGFVSAMFNKPFCFVSEFIGQIVRGFAPVPDAILR